MPPKPVWLNGREVENWPLSEKDCHPPQGIPIQKIRECLEQTRNYVLLKGDEAKKDQEVVNLGKNAHLTGMS